MAPNIKGHQNWTLVLGTTHVCVYIYIYIYRYIFIYTRYIPALNPKSLNPDTLNQNQGPVKAQDPPQA